MGIGAGSELGRGRVVREERKVTIRLPELDVGAYCLCSTFQSKWACVGGALGILGLPPTGAGNLIYQYSLVAVTVTEQLRILVLQCYYFY